MQKMMGNQLYSFLFQLKNSVFDSIWFSWDPVFLPKGEQQTYGEMTKERKNEISYRRVAIDKIIKHFAE